jgi:hypothetical protein
LFRFWSGLNFQLGGKEMAANEGTVAPQTTGINWAPNAKVASGVLAASMTTLIFSLWKPVTGHELQLPPESAGALTTLVTFVIQYFVPERK